MDYDTLADEIIARIPPLPELTRDAGTGEHIRFWRTPDDCLCPGTYSQRYNEPDFRFLERCLVYWERGCAMKLAQRTELTKDKQRELVRVCFRKLRSPSTLPLYPDFDYGDPPPRKPPTHTPEDEQNGRPVIV